MPSPGLRAPSISLPLGPRMKRWTAMYDSGGPHDPVKELTFSPGISRRVGRLAVQDCRSNKGQSSRKVRHSGVDRRRFLPCHIRSRPLLLVCSTRRNRYPCLRSGRSHQGSVEALRREGTEVWQKAHHARVGNVLLRHPQQQLPNRECTIDLDPG